MTAAGPHGIVILDKPEGPTSHAMVARARKAWGTRRVGHAGTLDPLATGVLVLGLGTATRLLGHLSAQGKEYVATIALGIATSTDDAQGEVLRLSRAWIGPFWFPGVERVVDAPAELFSGLVLHASTEVVGVDLRGHQQADPLAGPPVERLPPGFGSFRERRFAASPKLVEPLRAWCASFSAACVVVPVVGGRPRRL
jgi:hypothetical protein